MKTIVCHLNMFDIYQTVALYNEQGQFEKDIGLTTLDKLDSLLIALSVHYNIKRICLFGNPQCTKHTQQLAYQCAKNTYNINDIEIEVQ